MYIGEGGVRQVSDNDIIRLYFDRDERAIEATATAYGSYCETIAYNILENSEDSKECVNDAYLKTWDAIPPAKPESLRHFIGKITRNVAFDIYKRLHTQKRGGGQVAAALDELAECVSGGREPEAEYSKKELKQTINSFLDTLPDDKCAIFVSRYWYVKSVKDIAAEYDMSVTSVSVTLNRLRKRLREYLLERGFDV